MIHGAILVFPFYFNHCLPALQLAPANLQRAIESRVTASTVGLEDKTPLRRSPLLVPAFDANLCTTGRLRLSLLAYCVKVCEGLLEELKAPKLEVSFVHPGRYLHLRSLSLVASFLP